mgnify:CR=1 FL=1
MPRAEDIVNKILRVINRSGSGLSTEGQAVVREYGAKVEEINARLSRCVSLLRQGLRSEAIQLAEAAPPLLDEAAALEFPQRETFTLICQDVGLDLPELNFTGVEEINSAYPREQRLESLLRWHRRLALGRGPLKSRIRILRKLSAADVQNPIWGEDLVQFEKHRHKQIEQEAALAWNRKDQGAMANAYKECCVDPWLEPPPQTLMRSVKQWNSVLTDEHQRIRLAQLASYVDSAYQRQEASRVAAAVVQWRELAAAIDQDVVSLATPAVTDAITWLDQLDKQEKLAVDYQHACLAMEVALDERRPHEELERLWAAFGRLERPAPRMLQVRYQSQLNEGTLQGRRRHRMVLMGLLCLTAILISIVGVVIWQQRDQATMDQWVSQLEPLIQGQRWGEAKKLLGRIEKEEPAVWSAAAMQIALVEVDRALAEQGLRRQRFASALARARAASDTAPDLEAMKIARELAFTDEERLALETLEGELQTVEREEQAKRDQVFTAALDSLRSRYAEIRDDADTADMARRDGFDVLRGQLDQLLKMQQVSSTLTASGQALLASVITSTTSLSEKMARSRTVDEGLSAIRRSYNLPAVHAKTLSAFIEAHPSHPMTAEFRQSLELVEAWESVAVCDPILSRMAPLRVESYEEARKRLSVIEELAKKPTGVYRSAIMEYRDYLSTAVTALDPTLMTNRVNGDLSTLLSNRLVSGMDMLRLKSGAVLYVPRGSKLSPPTSGQLIVRFTRTFEQAFGDRATWDEKVLKAGDIDLSRNPAPAPQTAFATEASGTVKATGTDWENYHVRLCKLLSAHESIDPILRAGMMNQMVKWTVERDWPRHSELAQWHQKLRALPTEVEWLDTLNQAVEDQRTAALKVLHEQPDWGALLHRKAEWESNMTPQLSGRISMGVVWREDGLRTIVPNISPLQTGRMEVIVKTAQGEFKFEPIGTLSGGTATWLEAANTQPAGTVVYIATK